MILQNIIIKKISVNKYQLSVRKGNAVIIVGYLATPEDSDDLENIKNLDLICKTINKMWNKQKSK